MVSLEKEREIYKSKQLTEYNAKRYSQCTVLYTRNLRKSHEKDLCYDLATLEYRKGDYNKAIKKYSLADVLWPDHQRTYNAWGACLSHLGRYDEAIVKFKKCLKIDSNYGLCYFNWGLMLFWQKKKGKAEEIIEEGVKRTNMKQELIIKLYKFDLATDERRLENASDREERESLVWKIVGYNMMLELIPKAFVKKELGGAEWLRKKNVFESKGKVLVFFESIQIKRRILSFMEFLISIVKWFLEFVFKIFGVKRKMD